MVQNWDFVLNSNDFNQTFFSSRMDGLSTAGSGWLKSSTASHMSTMLRWKPSQSFIFFLLSHAFCDFHISYANLICIINVITVRAYEQLLILPLNFKPLCNFEGFWSQTTGSNANIFCVLVFIYWIKPQKFIRVNFCFR